MDEHDLVLKPVVTWGSHDLRTIASLTNREVSSHCSLGKCLVCDDPGVTRAIQEIPWLNTNLDDSLGTTPLTFPFFAGQNFVASWNHQFRTPKSSSRSPKIWRFQASEVSSDRPVRPMKPRSEAGNCNEKCHIETIWENREDWSFNVRKKMKNTIPIMMNHHRIAMHLSKWRAHVHDKTPSNNVNSTFLTNKCKIPNQGLVS